MLYNRILILRILLIPEQTGDSILGPTLQIIQLNNHEFGIFTCHKVVCEPYPLMSITVYTHVWYHAHRLYDYSLWVSMGVCMTVDTGTVWCIRCMYMKPHPLIGNVFSMCVNLCGTTPIGNK